MKVYQDSDYPGRYELTSKTGDKITNWSWFDLETGDYAVPNGSEREDGETIFHAFKVKDFAHEDYIWIFAKNFRQARRKLESIEKSGDFKVLKKSYRSDRWDLRVEDKNGKIINWRALPGGYEHAHKELSKILSTNPSAFCVLQFKEAVKE